MGVGTEELIGQVKKLLDGALMIPSIQRDYVWARSQIPRLLDSLYKGYPVGSLLIWETNLDIPLKPAAVLQGTPLQGRPAVLLDGQQRLTSLAWVINPSATPDDTKPPDVRFDLRTEDFLNPSAAQRNDSFLVSVTDLLSDGVQYGEILTFVGIDSTDVDYQTYYERLSRVHKIRDYLIGVQTYSSDDYEEVAEIFARVNTGGRRLSKGDLAMSAIAARWGEGLDRIKTFEKELTTYDFPLDREAILRLMGLMAGVGADSIRLIKKEMTADKLKTAWNDTEEALKLAIDFFKNAASVPKSGLLTSPNVVVVPAYLLFQRRQQLIQGEQDNLRRWLYTAMAFSHYSNQVESKLDAEAKAIRELPTGDLWSDLIRRASGPRSVDSPVAPVDLEEKGSRSPFFNLLYIAALDVGAKDWWNNVALASAPIGRGHKIEYHHVFPQAKTKSIYKASLRDSIANLAFLSAIGNKRVGAKDPSTYLPAIDSTELAKQWVPPGPALWVLDRFPDFCSARRYLLAQQINKMLGLPDFKDGANPELPLDEEEADSAQLDEGSAEVMTGDEDIWNE
jgi:hypothetical protein